MSELQSVLGDCVRLHFVAINLDERTLSDIAVLKGNILFLHYISNIYINICNKYERQKL